MVPVQMRNVNLLKKRIGEICINQEVDVGPKFGINLFDNQNGFAYLLDGIPIGSQVLFHSHQIENELIFYCLKRYD